MRQETKAILKKAHLRLKLFTSFSHQWTHRLDSCTPLGNFSRAVPTLSRLVENERVPRIDPQGPEIQVLILPLNGTAGG